MNEAVLLHQENHRQSPKTPSGTVSKHATSIIQLLVPLLLQCVVL